MSKTCRRLTTTRALLGLALATCVAGAAGSSVGGAAAAACPTYNPPNALTLAGGTPQSAQLGAPFSDPLQVTLVNTNGCPLTTPLAGIAVTFAAPGGGPSGTFSSSGSNEVLVGTNVSGDATAPQFTANRLAGGYQLVASSDYGSVSFSLVNTASGVAATITPGGSASQSATVGSRYAQPLQATVLDVNGSPIDGATVTFTIGSAGGAAGAGGGASGPGANFDGAGVQVNELTNASGIATSPLFTANATAGRFTATAATVGTNDLASYPLDNIAGKPPTIRINGNAKQSAPVGAAYAKPLQVKVRDGAGRPLQGASVTFTLGAAGTGGAGTASTAGAGFTGGAAQATETTNAAGLATSPRLTANTTAGTFTATVTTTGTSKAARFVLHNRAGKPTAVSAGTAATESTTVGTRFPIRLAVTVTDKYGNPVAGVAVSFSAPARGASGRFGGTKRATTTKTDAKGIAVAPPFVANRTAGGYVVRASVAGRSAAFALVNQPAL
jgi:adhesin/invasin